MCFYFTEYGFCDLFAEVIREKGLDEITLEGLVDEITPHARGEIAWPPKLFLASTTDHLRLDFYIRYRSRSRQNGALAQD